MTRITLRIKGRDVRRPFARTLTRLSRLRADSVTCAEVRGPPPYGRAMVASLAVSLVLVAPVAGPGRARVLLRRRPVPGRLAPRRRLPRRAGGGGARGVRGPGRVGGPRRGDAALRRVPRHPPAAGDDRRRARRACGRGGAGRDRRARRAPRGPAPRRPPRAATASRTSTPSRSCRSAPAGPGGASSAPRVSRRERRRGRCRARRGRAEGGAAAAPRRRAPASGGAARRARAGRGWRRRCRGEPRVAARRAMSRRGFESRRPGSRRGPRGSGSRCSSPARWAAVCGSGCGGAARRWRPPRAGRRREAHR